ncbi:MAG: SPOR domain-containing protein [Rhodospirillales bacterium]|jgi:hypothetical protein|nr:SPOR domain-containing protein [Rhodospirillales bacterium]MDP6774440.1 SPOR domain-containing protein [Rhodospirillales bacterium]
MRKTGAALIGLLILSGCALPVPLRVASWAIDGVAYLTTKKSIADHGISLVAERDCAMWRSLTADEVCIDNDAGSSTAVAEAEAPDDTDGAESLASFETAAGIQASEPDAHATPRVVVWLEELASGEVESAAAFWQTAAGESDEPRATGWPRGEGADEIDPAVAPFPAPFVEGDGRDGEEAGAPPVTGWNSSNIFESDTLEVAAVQRVPRQPAPRRAVARNRPDAGALRLVVSTNSLRAMPPQGARAPRGIYFVVGSFRSLDNARGLARRHVSLRPVVMSAELDGGIVFRVMVGPFTKRERQDGRRRVIQAGIFDAWAISLDTEDWRMAGVVDWPAREVASTADIVDGR